MKEEKWIRVYKFFDSLQGEELEQILKDNNIPVRLISRYDSVFDSIFRPQNGEGIIEIMQSFIEQAQRIIADYEKLKHI